MKTYLQSYLVYTERILVILFFASVIQLHGQTGPVAFYPFSGNTLDASGNGNDGTPSGAFLTTDRFGQVNNAYFFDGINDYIEFIPNQDFQPQLPATITAWVLIDDYNPNTIFRNSYQQNIYAGVWLAIINGRVTSNYCDGGPSGPGSRRSKTGTTILNLNTWYHLTIIIRGPQDMNIYVNGVEDCGTYSGAGGPLGYINATGRAGETDGVTGPTGQQFFHGKMDDIRLYDRELSLAEIRALADYTGIQDVSICPGDSIALSAGAGFTQTWSPTTGLSCSTCPEPIASPQTTTTYFLTRTNAAGCVSFDTVTVNVTACTACDSILVTPDVNHVMSETSISALDVSSGPIDSIIWDLGDGTQIPGMPGDSLNYTYALDGTYQVCLYTFTQLPDTVCSDTFCFSVVAMDSLDCSDLNLIADWTVSMNGITFTGQDLSSGMIDSVIWDMGNGFQINGNIGDSLTYSFPVPGTYQPCLYIYGNVNGTLCVDSICTTITAQDTILCQDLALNAAMSSIIANELIINVQDLSSGQIDSLVWDFGDGTSVNGQPGMPASYTYAADGTYEVCLYIYGFATDTICVDSICSQITVMDSVTCDELGIMAVMVSQSSGVNLNVTDFSTGGVDSIVWDVGNGVIISDQPGGNLSYTYPVQGTYQLCLYAYGFATDSLCMDSVCLTVLAQEEFNCSTLGLSAAFSYQTQNYDVSCVGQTSGGTVDYVEWDFGDGTVLTLPPGVSPTHTYSMDGSYQICMTAIDSVDEFNECTAVECQVVVITGQTCEDASLDPFFSYSANGLSVNFQDLSTGSSIDLLEWVWGDGTSGTSAPGALVNHVYALPGTYQVCLTAIDEIDETLVCDSTYCTLIELKDNGVSIDQAQLEVFDLRYDEASEILTVTSELVGKIKLTVVDVQGRYILRKREIQNSTDLKTAKWAKGVYVIWVESEKGMLPAKWVKY